MSAKYWILAIGLGVTVSACGGSSGDNERAATNAGPGVGPSIRTADCRGWRAATTAQRLATIAQLRTFNAGPIGSGGGGPEAPGPVLPDDRAYELFQSYCSQPFARAFKLYKLYGRAAGFVGAAG